MSAAGVHPDVLHPPDFLTQLPEAGLDGVLVVHLDQWVWVELARAAAGIQRDATASRLLHVLGEGRDDGRLLLPLGATHYLELWHRSTWQSRHDLAAVMARLSGYVTIAPSQVIVEQELMRLASMLVGGTGLPVRVFGTGVNHAFMSKNGRFRVVESLWREDRDEGPPVEGVDLVDAQSVPRVWEWFNLAGPDEDFPIEEFDIDLRPEHRRGDDWIETSDHLRQWLDEDHRWALARETLVAYDFNYELQSVIPAVAARFGLHVLDLLGGVGPDVLQRFHAALPSRDTLVTVWERALRNRSARWKQHDRADMLAAAAAIPYCDVVVLDKYWAHIANSSGVAANNGCLVTRDLAVLLRRVEAHLGQEVSTNGQSVIVSDELAQLPAHGRELIDQASEDPGPLGGAATKVLRLA